MLPVDPHPETRGCFQCTAPTRSRVHWHVHMSSLPEEENKGDTRETRTRDTRITSRARYHCAKSWCVVDISEAKRIKTPRAITIERIANSKISFPRKSYCTSSAMIKGNKPRADIHIKRNDACINCDDVMSSCVPRDLF